MLRELLAAELSATYGCEWIKYRWSDVTAPRELKRNGYAMRGFYQLRLNRTSAGDGGSDSARPHLSGRRPRRLL